MRKGKLIRGKDGRYLKVTPLNQCKSSICELIRKIKGLFK